MANRRGDSLGAEGRYRRTASPQTGKKPPTLMAQMTELSRHQVHMSQLASHPTLEQDTNEDHANLTHGTTGKFSSYFLSSVIFKVGPFYNSLKCISTLVTL
jgi:hypothetical protein